MPVAHDRVRCVADAVPGLEQGPAEGDVLAADERRVESTHRLERVAAHDHVGGDDVGNAEEGRQRIGCRRRTPRGLTRRGVLVVEMATHRSGIAQRGDQRGEPTVGDEVVGVAERDQLGAGRSGAQPDVAGMCRTAQLGRRHDRHSGVAHTRHHFGEGAARSRIGGVLRQHDAERHVDPLREHRAQLRFEQLVDRTDGDHHAGLHGDQW